MNRSYNRKNNQLRPFKFIENFTTQAYSSVLVEFGNTKVIVALSFEKTKPRWMEKDDLRGWITAEYSLLPSSTNPRNTRERSKISGRTQEIQRLIGRSLRSCVDLAKIPDMTITIDADVIQADGSTRCASICGAFFVLKKAINKMLLEGIISENPIIEHIAAVSVGILNDQVILDLDYSEDSKAQVDSNIVLTQSGKIIEFQTTAEQYPFDQTKLFEMLQFSQNAVNTIINSY